jgi:hypothetical protein
VKDTTQQICINTLMKSLRFSGVLSKRLYTFYLEYSSLYTLLMKVLLSDFIINIVINGYVGKIILIAIILI